MNKSEKSDEKIDYKYLLVVLNEDAYQTGHSYIPKELSDFEKSIQEQLLRFTASTTVKVGKYNGEEALACPDVEITFNYDDMYFKYLLITEINKDVFDIEKLNEEYYLFNNSDKESNNYTIEEYNEFWEK